MDKFDRRRFVEAALKSSLIYLSYPAGAGTVSLTPAAARARELPLQALTHAEAQVLEVLGETVVPGSARLGLIHFLDHQLRADPNDALLIAKYFQVALPYAAFYRSGAHAASRMAHRLTGKTIPDSSAAELVTLVKEMSVPGTALDGFPVNLFYLCLRSDAVDVVYGSPEGFKSLNIPYMQHIAPPEGWDG